MEMNQINENQQGQELKNLTEEELLQVYLGDEENEAFEGMKLDNPYLGMVLRIIYTMTSFTGPVC